MSEVLYTATATTIGGLEGRVQSDDQVIDFETALPGSQKSEDSEATNPEQLFAAAYATCFDSALQIVADKEQLEFQSEVTAKVDLLEDGEGYKLAVHLQVKGNNIEKSQLEQLVQKANQIWPYAEAKRATMEFTIETQG
ncbi:Ohr family peroxiredoxin [Ureibacillus acetophenoni]|uniref:Ohr subfamily peroxiredoxin n=1 Tax=Ureibacillus acetophenoni TaxID=614649 RepID=A0A285USH5_9BACL|nr:Ohr family peroxiredoxin [Ureibacillus acetophenoni]SOC43211.1 Ohr subfamily peroxiredoxin [Ureibacillus acetophenoni]